MESETCDAQAMTPEARLLETLGGFQERGGKPTSWVVRKFGGHSISKDRRRFPCHLAQHLFFCCYNLFLSGNDAIVQGQGLDGQEQADVATALLALCRRLEPIAARRNVKAVILPLQQGEVVEGPGPFAFVLNCLLMQRGGPQSHKCMKHSYNAYPHRNIAPERVPPRGNLSSRRPPGAILPY